MESYERLHREATVVDTHCDTLKTLMPIFTNSRDSMWEDRSEAGIGARSELGHIDIPRLFDGGVNCQVFAISSERKRKSAFPLRTALMMIERFYFECNENSSWIEPVVSYEQIVESVKGGKIAALLSIEGADVLEGSPELAGIYHRLGVRMVGIVHSLRNLLADGVTDCRTLGGISALGVEVVRRLDDLDMIIDVSHLNDEGFWDLIDITDNPFIASHSNSRSVCEHPRNLSDDMIQALADKGGVMGMNFAPSFVHPIHATVSRLVDHIDHIVDLVGPEHVGLGSDFDGIPSTPEGLEDVSKMPNITNELAKRGYPEEDIKKILGGNHLRLVKEVIG
ncbi:MAG: dipeptidase [Candidatus Bathyarchaeia archaeon]